jgi:hypothetical protein
MASTKPEKSNPVSVNRATNRLSPCLKLLIEILVNEVTTHNSAVTALNETDLEKDEGVRPIRHQSADLAIADLAIKGECYVSE